MTKQIFKSNKQMIWEALWTYELRVRVSVVCIQCEQENQKHSIKCSQKEGEITILVGSKSLEETATLTQINRRKNKQKKRNMVLQHRTGKWKLNG